MSAVTDHDIATQEMESAVLGGRSDAESCRSCGSTVARGQRYCLACGARRSERPVPFAQSVGVPSPEASVVAAKAARAGGAISPALAAAMVCASVLFLGTGVLIGRSSGSGGGGNVAQTPQVITVPAGGTADAGAAATTGNVSSGGTKKTRTVIKAAPVPKISAADQAKAEKAMNCSTPQECQDAMKKIPNKVVTKGKTAPIDNKAPAGGAQGQVFK